MTAASAPASPSVCCAGHTGEGKKLRPHIPFHQPLPNPISQRLQPPKRSFPLLFLVYGPLHPVRVYGELVREPIGHGHDLDEEEVEAGGTDERGERVRGIVRREGRLERHWSLRTASSSAGYHGIVRCMAHVRDGCEVCWRNLQQSLTSFRNLMRSGSWVQINLFEYLCWSYPSYLSAQHCDMQI